MPTRRARTGKKNQNKNQSTTFNFDLKICQACPLKDDAKSKTYAVSIKSTDYKDQANSQVTEVFKELERNRYKMETKNNELKNPHGYDTVQSVGLFGMEIQGATTIFALNLKRIIKLIQGKRKESPKK